MAETVITLDGDTWAMIWAEQYCRIRPWTNGLRPPSDVRTITKLRSDNTKESLLLAFREAAQKVGATGHIIFNSGHGYGGLGRNPVIIFTPDFQVNRAMISGQNHSTVFDDIGNAIQGRKLTILVCSIGGHPSFMRELKDKWRLSNVVGYGDYTTLDADKIPPLGMNQVNYVKETYPRVRLYLYDDNEFFNQNAGSTRVPNSWLELPPFGVPAIPVP